MSFEDIVCDVANNMGRLAGKGRNVLLSARKKLEDSTQGLNPKELPQKIRNAVFEKLSRTLYKQAEFVLGKVSERMEVIDEVARPFYEKVNALSSQGPVSEGQLWQALNSIEAAKKLTDEEKVLLLNIFGAIIGSARSKYVDAVVLEEDAASRDKIDSPKPGLTDKSGTDSKKDH